ncbi:hypothetical protein DL764_001015 [Monosporascus ibericus]|uniref:Uncharacterized protein n=1 Tax=Monosporascus ibericus TaxID=155417 RepID=A0A4Q4TRC3_9PEZI|nr:hypothetical protein DL764_001015 [Monosporascus ibericus]
MTSALLRRSLVLASHASLAAAAERDASHITPRQSAGIASTPGHSAPKKIDTDHWPALIANPDETGVYPVPGFDASRPSCKRISRKAVSFEAHEPWEVRASTITLSRQEDRDWPCRDGGRSCSSLLSKDCVCRIEEAPGVCHGCSAPRLDRLPDECSVNFTAATNPTAYGYSRWKDEIGDEDEARDANWLRGSEIRNTASDPAPAHSNGIQEMAERTANATDMLLIRWGYNGEHTDERETPRLRSTLLYPEGLNATSEMEDGTSSALLIGAHLPMAFGNRTGQLLPMWAREFGSSRIE